MQLQKRVQWDARECDLLAGASCWYHMSASRASLSTSLPSPGFRPPSPRVVGRGQGERLVVGASEHGVSTEGAFHEPGFEDCKAFHRVPLTPGGVRRAVERLSQNPKPGRASVRASPNISGNLRKSGLARTLALPNGRFLDDPCQGGQTRVGMARASRIIASCALGAARRKKWPGSKSAVTNARPRLSRNPRPGWVAHDGALWSDAPCAPEPGKDAFHRVPFIPGEVRDAVERVLTILEDRFMAGVLLLWQQILDF